MGARQATVAMSTGPIIASEKSLGRRPPDPPGTMPFSGESAGSSPTLGRQGQFVEPPRRVVSARQRRPPRPYAIRKPRGYDPTHPGD
jgi:hypothetical protein